jgi:hypothetical protein
VSNEPLITIWQNPTRCTVKLPRESKPTVLLPLVIIDPFIPAIPAQRALVVRRDDLVQEQTQQVPAVYSIEAAPGGGYHVAYNGELAHHGERLVIFGTVQFALDHIWFDAAYAEIEEPEIRIDLDTLGVHPTLRHPTDPSLFKSHEGYVTASYITRRCLEVECTYSLWNGSRKNGQYVPARPVTFENMSRMQAYTELVYALNAGDETINKWRQAYSDIHTREVTE